MSVWWSLIDSALFETICREDERAGTLISVQEAGGRNRNGARQNGLETSGLSPVEGNIVRLSVAMPRWVQRKEKKKKPYV